MHIFTNKIKRNFFLLIFLTFLTSVFEFLSISTLPVVFSYFASTEILFEVYFLKIYKFSNNYFILDYGIFLILISFIFFFIRFIFGLVSANFFAIFYASLKIFLTNSTVESLYNWPFQKIKEIGSTVLVRRTVIDTDIYLQQNILPTFNLFNDIFLSIPILAICLLINPLLFLFIVIVIFLIIFTLYPLLRYGYYNWGKIKMFQEELRHKFANQFFLNLKQIIIDDLFTYFSSRVNHATTNSAIAESKQIYYQILPRLTLEFLSILLFFIIILFYYNTVSNSENFINTIVIYGIAALRIIPNINRIFISAQSIKFSKEAKDNVFKILSIKNKPLKGNKSNNVKKLGNTEDIIEFKNVNIGYGKKVLINNINLSFPKKGLIAVYGESGLGKTSFLEAIMGLLEVKKGNIYYAGLNILKIKKQFQNQISYVAQEKILDNVSMYENIVLKRSHLSINSHQIKEYLQKFKLNEFCYKKSLFDKDRIGEFGNKLSEGQKQRVVIIRSLIKKPKILLLDEPTSALDSDNKNILINLLKELSAKILIILVSHDKSITKFCNKSYLIKNKKIYEVHK